MARAVGGGTCAPPLAVAPVVGSESSKRAHSLATAAIVGSVSSPACRSPLILEFYSPSGTCQGSPKIQRIFSDERPQGAALDRTHPPSLLQLSGERPPHSEPQKRKEKSPMIEDIMSFAAVLYSGGWRAEDEGELMEEHQLSKSDARLICDILQRYEEEEEPCV